MHSENYSHYPVPGDVRRRHIPHRTLRVLLHPAVRGARPGSHRPPRSGPAPMDPLPGAGLEAGEYLAAGGRLPGVLRRRLVRLERPFPQDFEAQVSVVGR